LPHCDHPIGALENIPLLSWLWLRGRCRNCHAPISARYPLVELLTALLSVSVAAALSPGWGTLAALLLTWTLVALTFIDLDKMLLPDQLTLPLLWGGLLFNLAGGFVPLADGVVGATTLMQLNRAVGISEPRLGTVPLASSIPSSASQAAHVLHPGSPEKGRRRT
jgi:prepilin signal peptidase PulO-like enzyme (type II secretory pathway)